MSRPPNGQDIEEAEPLTLHAELLPNIRQVSLHISVPARLQSVDTAPEIKISLSESRRAVSVSLAEPLSHVSQTVKLPARVNEASRRVLTVSNARDARGGGGAGNKEGNHTREFSYRMQVDSVDEAESLRAAEEHMDGFVPWTAADMYPSTRLRCRQCRKVVLDTPADAPQSEEATLRAGWVWKDLPSGNWAEMMDFWHCHKPDPHEDDTSNMTAEDENSTVKGYGASNQVLASPGTVLVDVATFLVSDIECKGLKKAPEKQLKDSLLPSTAELVCEECDTLIGVEDTIAKGWRLFKTSLSAGSLLSNSCPEEVTWESHPAELIVAAQLLELVERESARRFIIHCGGKDGLLAWVFNPDMRYSNASSERSITSQRALKVFFQMTANAEEVLHPEPGKTSSLSLEELRLPSSTFASLSHALESSNAMLPLSARTFQQWRVGILHRFERLRRT